MSPDELAKMTAFSGSKAYGYLKHLATTIGPRWTGSPAEHRAARYLAKMFRQFGLTTRLQQFPVRTFSNSKCTFAVRDGGKWRPIAIQPVCMTASVRNLTGEMYYLESAARECWTDEMAGKIILSPDCHHPADRPLLIRKYKPAAWVLIETHLAPEPVRFAMPHAERRDFGDIPHARMTHLDAVDIVKRGLTAARMTMINTDRPSHSLNVIGEVTGGKCPDEIVVICAHYDSSFGISGASDNAGGTAVMMELARTLAVAKPLRTLRFIGFAAEETRMQGSKHYAWDLSRRAERRKKAKTFNAKTHKTELDRHVFCLNIDVQGAVIGRHSFSFAGVEDIGASVRLLAKETGIPANVSQGAGMMDGSALAAVGIPALQFARSAATGGYMHTSLDDIKFLSADALVKAGRFVELYLRRHFAAGKALPFPREIPPDQTKKLEGFKKADHKRKTKRAAKTARRR